MDRELIPTGLGVVRNAYTVFVRNLNGKNRNKKWDGDIKICPKMSGVIWLRKVTNRWPL